MKLAKNIRASGGGTKFYFNFLIVLIINLIFFNWSVILCLYCNQVCFGFKDELDKTCVTQWNWIYFFHCGFIFFFHWRTSSQDMFQWPNLKCAQERSLCLRCREELARFRSSSRMSTTGLLSVFRTGCSSWAIMVPAVVKQYCTANKSLGFSFV